MIAGLVPGQTYDLSFAWADAQQAGFTGPTNDQFKVTLGGGPAVMTPIITDPSQGFSGWHTFSAVITAGAGNTLEFTDLGKCLLPGAVCGPDDSGGPPFSLLDSVSLSVPEPSTWAMMLLGFVGLGFAGYRSRRTAISIV